jgi:hypothetical protein
MVHAVECIGQRGVRIETIVTCGTVGMPGTPGKIGGRQNPASPGEREEAPTEARRFGEDWAAERTVATPKPNTCPPLRGPPAQEPSGIDEVMERVVHAWPARARAKP